MSDLISRKALLEKAQYAEIWTGEEEFCWHGVSVEDIEKAPAVDAVELPCKIGDSVWTIRSYKGVKQPKKGIVGDMFFTHDMRLMIVVHHIARGRWGETIFATKEDALKAIGERKTYA